MGLGHYVVGAFFLGYFIVLFYIVFYKEKEKGGSK